MLLLLLALALPPELTRFIEKGADAIAVEQGDLNRDGRGDYALVVEWPAKEDIPRSLLIIVRGADGSLKLAKRSDKAVYCRECGGMMGDPFQGIEIKKDRFVIHHYGGSAWRWGNDITFAWSRRDRTWQLVRVEDSSFHAGDPDHEKRTIRKPPRDFGKIDLADFDPENYLGKGPK